MVQKKKKDDAKLSYENIQNFFFFQNFYLSLVNVILN